MAKAMPQHGATIVFGDGGTFLLRSITPPSQDIGEINITTHASTGNEEFMKGDLQSWGLVEGEILATEQGQPTPGTYDVITVTSATPVGASSGAIWTGNGYVKSVTPNALSANSNEPASYNFNVRFLAKGLDGSGVGDTGTDVSYTSPT